MSAMSHEYISLDALSGRLGLPQCFLRDLAVRGLIPCVKVHRGQWLRFDEDAVCEALRRLPQDKDAGPVAVGTSPRKPAGQAKRTTARPRPAAGPVAGFRTPHVTHAD